MGDSTTPPQGRRERVRTRCRDRVFDTCVDLEGLERRDGLMFRTEELIFERAVIHGDRDG